MDYLLNPTEIFKGRVEGRREKVVWGRREGDRERGAGMKGKRGRKGGSVLRKEKKGN